MSDPGEAELPPLPVDLASLLAESGAAVAGALVIRETPEDFSLHVWQALRLTYAWAAGPDVSAAVFDAEDLDGWEADVLRAGEGVDEGLWAPVSVLAGELSHPGDADPARLAHACLAVTDWALEQGADGTARLFGEAAAAVWPNNARIAWIVGRIHRDQGQLGRAEAWLQYASRIGVQTGDWELHAQAINSLGNLKIHLGDLAAGENLLLRALHVARRRRLYERYAMVLHDLFVACTYAGRFDEADAYAQQAFAAYGPDHPNAVNLAFDVAHLCTKQGQFARALQVLEPLGQRFTEPDRRLRVVASIARAAGEAGDADSFGAASREAWSIMDDREVDELLPRPCWRWGWGRLAWDCVSRRRGRWRTRLMARAGSGTALPCPRRKQRLITFASRSRMHGPGTPPRCAPVRPMRPGGSRGCLIHQKSSRPKPTSS